MNRHTIAASYDTLDGYVATDNFVQSQGPAYGFGGLDKTANFDVHGSLSANCADRSAGYAGDYVIISYNTLLSDDRPNIKIRGQSCRLGIVAENVFAEGSTIVSADIGAPPDYDCYSAIGGAVVNYDTNGYAAIPPPNLYIASTNAYSQPAPVNEIAVGDFDGDGIDDIFTTTGTGWFYSSGGVSEWRWLRRTPEKVDVLRLGDLDGDGRTDVITAKGNTLLVSWGGVSGWQQLTTTPAALPITSYAIGNFDGDRLHGDDIFATDGATWWVAKNGHNFAPVNTSSFPASSLRFGDFDGDGKTDVFAITGLPAAGRSRRRRRRRGRRSPARRRRATSTASSSATSTATAAPTSGATRTTSPQPRGGSITRRTPARRSPAGASPRAQRRGRAASRSAVASSGGTATSSTLPSARRRPRACRGST